MRERERKRGERDTYRRSLCHWIRRRAGRGSAGPGRDDWVGLPSCAAVAAGTGGCACPSCATAGGTGGGALSLLLGTEESEEGEDRRGRGRDGEEERLGRRWTREGERESRERGLGREEVAAKAGREGVRVRVSRGVFIGHGFRWASNGLAGPKRYISGGSNREA